MNESEPIHKNFHTQKEEVSTAFPVLRIPSGGEGSRTHLIYRGLQGLPVGQIKEACRGPHLAMGVSALER